MYDVRTYKTYIYAFSEITWFSLLAKAGTCNSTTNISDTCALWCGNTMTGMLGESIDLSQALRNSV